MLRSRHLRRHPLDPGDVTPEPDHRRIDDGAHPRLGQRRQLGHRVSDPLLLVAPLVREVLLDVGREYEDVLVHVRPSEVCGVDRTEHRLDGGHDDLPAFVPNVPLAGRRWPIVAACTPPRPALRPPRPTTAAPSTRRRPRRPTRPVPVGCAHRARAPTSSIRTRRPRELRHDSGHRYVVPGPRRSPNHHLPSPEVGIVQHVGRRVARARPGRRATTAGPAARRLPHGTVHPPIRSSSTTMFRPRDAWSANRGSLGQLRSTHGGQTGEHRVGVAGDQHVGSVGRGVGVGRRHARAGLPRCGSG